MSKIPDWFKTLWSDKSTEEISRLYSLYTDRLALEQTRQGVKTHVEDSSQCAALNPKDFDLVWLAGIFEGEGCCGVYYKPKRNTYSLLVDITNTDKTLVNEVHRILGTGFVNSKKRKAPWKQVHMYRAESASARDVLTKLLPYVRSKVKQTQIKNALAKDALHVRARGIYGRD